MGIAVDFIGESKYKGMMDFLHTQLPSVHVFSQVRQLSDGFTASAQVRQLLKMGLAKLGIYDELDDSQFPYRLKESQRMLCFSHSSERVCVVLAKQPAKWQGAFDIGGMSGIGIDTEQRAVSLAVARRFFAKSEIAFLNTLASTQQRQVCQLLWMVKEAHIKAVQTTLTKGLAVNMADFFALDKLLTLHQCTADVTPLNTAHAGKPQFLWLPQHASMLCLL